MDEQFNPSRSSYLDHGVVHGVRRSTSKAQRGDGWSFGTLEFRGDEVEARDAVGGRRLAVSAFTPHN